MLLSEIVFLRDKNKGRQKMGGSRIDNSNFLGDMDS